MSNDTMAGELLSTAGIVVVAIILFIVLYAVQKYEKKLASESK